MIEKNKIQCLLVTHGVILDSFLGILLHISNIYSKNNHQIPVSEDLC